MTRRASPDEIADHERDLRKHEITGADLVSTNPLTPGERAVMRRHCPYGEMCRDPRMCMGVGYCPLDPTCGD